jgi:hypothetical protein
VDFQRWSSIGWLLIDILQVCGESRTYCSSSASCACAHEEQVSTLGLCFSQQSSAVYPIEKDVELGNVLTCVLQ